MNNNNYGKKLENTDIEKSEPIFLKFNFDITLHLVAGKYNSWYRGTKNIRRRRLGFPNLVTNPYE